MVTSSNPTGCSANVNEQQSNIQLMRKAVPSLVAQILNFGKSKKVKKVEKIILGFGKLNAVQPKNSHSHAQIIEKDSFDSNLHLLLFSHFFP